MARRPSLLPKKSKKTVRKTKSETYIINTKYLGGEPSFKGVMSTSDMIKALNWYNIVCLTEEAREYLDTYLMNMAREKDAKIMRSVSDSLFPKTAAWVARMISNGIPVDNSQREYIDSKIAEAKVLLASKKEKEPSKVVNIQDRMREKAGDFIADIESLIDSNEPFSLYDLMKAREIPPAYCQYVIEYYAPVLQELLEATETKADADLKEGYSHLKKAQIVALVKKFSKIIEEAEQYGTSAKKARAVERKPKLVSVEKKLKNFNYQKEDSNFKIASMNPEKLISSSEVWLFNTKYKTFTILRGNEGGLQVKGTSFDNYDEANSFTIRVGRKAADFLNSISKASKASIKKLVNTDDKIALAYRSNENVILLKVFS